MHVFWKTYGDQAVVLCYPFHPTPSIMYITVIAILQFLPLEVEQTMALNYNMYLAVYMSYCKFTIIRFTQVTCADNKSEFEAVLCFRETSLGQAFHDVHVINNFMCVCVYVCVCVCVCVRVCVHVLLYHNYICGEKLSYFLRITS